MGKCIVYKMFETIQDDSLVTMDEIRLKGVSTQFTSTGAHESIYITAVDGDVTIKAIKGFLSTDSQGSSPISGEFVIHSGTGGTIYANDPAGGKVEVSVKGKGNIKRYSSRLAFNAAQAEFMPNFLPSVVCLAEGNCKDIKYITPGTEFGSTTLRIIGNLSGMFDSAAKQKISQYKVLTTWWNLNGDFDFLADTESDTIQLYFADPFDLTSVIASNPNVKYFHFNGVNNIWESTTLRNSSYPILEGYLHFLNTESADNFLINMAACQPQTGTNKTINMNNGAPRSEASDSAVNTLVGMGYTITCKKV